jgi:hypothetical protein
MQAGWIMTTLLLLGLGEERKLSGDGARGTKGNPTKTVWKRVKEKGDPRRPGPTKKTNEKKEGAAHRRCHLSLSFVFNEVRAPSGALAPFFFYSSAPASADS